jgi:hypothetical protein
MRIRFLSLAAVGAVVLVSGCAARHTHVTDPVEVIQAQTEVPEERLLDVTIVVFDPGLADKDELELAEKGIFPDVRKSEARFIPVHLMRTLQATGHWGAVRVMPAEGASDLMVFGQIQRSNGKDLDLEIRVLDATGEEWLERTYRGRANGQAYVERPPQQQGEEEEPYQDLYNQIANDILEERNRRKPEEIERVREAALLRFAADLAPQAFGDYLSVDDRGRVEVERLPAEDDPMLARIARIRVRDDLFVDTLNEHYADFYERMDEPYDDWRTFSYEEQLAYEELRKESILKKVLGGLALLGAALTDGNSSGARIARDAAMIGGMAAIQSGMQKGEEAKIHLAALKELAASFDSEIAPLLVDVEGQTLRLTGSAETQFATWRKLLRELFAAEKGLPLDPNTAEPLSEQGSPD